jgi:hypothetical protein
MHTPVHGSSRSPASPAAVERAVAKVAAAGADPVWVCSDLVDIFPVSHVQAVSTEVAEQALTPGAGSSLAKSLLAALVAGHAINLVIHLKDRRMSILLRQFRRQQVSG